MSHLQTLSGGRDKILSQSAPTLKQNNSNFGVESLSISQKPSLPISDSVDDLLTLKPPDIDTTRVLLDSDAIPSTQFPEKAELVIQQVKESSTAGGSPQIKSLTGLDLKSGPPSLSDTPKRVSFEVSENPPNLEALTQKPTAPSEEPRSYSLKPISEASTISILSVPDSKQRPQPQLSPFAAVVSPRRNEVQSSRSTPKNAPNQMFNPFANAQPSREDVSETQQIDLSSASPFETASYQVRDRIGCGPQRSTHFKSCPTL